ncbi:hypothetical protein SAMN05216251_108177 [Actinacidiphila alni]|uniref:Uncharacterized protein n=1 Tax=Actinacidiphila alni TaxID=380248 RepID=A0A1I2G175_9ACTN|nr:hypothetical protein [Actinacidiphila alni]SFF10710.1 hypothetical protein SAMN05216251_108177 [Actinacidiphila alni]
MSSAPEHTAAENADDEPAPETVSPVAPVSPAGPTGTGSGSAGLIFDDPLDRPSADDTDRGWGERPSGSAADDDDFTRFLNEKPPHHI